MSEKSFDGFTFRVGDDLDDNAGHRVLWIIAHLHGYKFGSKAVKFGWVGLRPLVQVSRVRFLEQVESMGEMLPDRLCGLVWCTLRSAMWVVRMSFLMRQSESICCLQSYRHPIQTTKIADNCR